MHKGELLIEICGENKQVYVQIEYLSSVHTKGNFEKVPGHIFFKLLLKIHTSM